ncbi:DUF429 domain-containing protein [Crenobacter sp. SG2305]|uniref:DUF429 domain-containing protein n=1 Tax=Crenobacter oryzisoli TaxID=3056844 RepID=UPI0025AB38B8|nr:DUF429 domain-containing protein [Crenobacter sp. SG2305]MDN0081260.1 DUF429 domain-containing protein [Crenobacter sp. SG2305]
MRNTLFGVDFSSRPSRRKPIVVAAGHLDGHVCRLGELERLPTLADFDVLLARPGPWLAGFDFPFSLPRALVEEEGWPDCWPALMAWLSTLPADRARPFLKRRFQAWCDARPAGQKFAHRACDRLAGSSPSMKWVNPPVAWMLLEGAPRLALAGVSVPGLVDGDPLRIALEAYPGYVARQITRASYKSDDRARQTEARRIERARIVGALEAGALPGWPHLSVPAASRAELLDDASGDALDAALCLLQAAWAEQRRDRRFGLPDEADPLEGWIVSVPFRG